MDAKEFEDYYGLPAPDRIPGSQPDGGPYVYDTEFEKWWAEKYTSLNSYQGDSVLAANVVLMTKVAAHEAWLESRKPKDAPKKKTNAALSAEEIAKRDPDVRARMRDIGVAIDERLPDGFGFFVMVYPFGDAEGRSNYASNGERKAVMNLMKEFIIRNGAGEDWMKHLE